MTSPLGKSVALHLNKPEYVRRLVETGPEVLKKMNNLHDSDKDGHILIRKASCQGELEKKDIGKRIKYLETFLHFF